MERLARELLDMLKAERLMPVAIHSVLKNLLQKSSDNGYRVRRDAARQHVHDWYHDADVVRIGLRNLSF